MKKTPKNLAAAFVGESQARNRYSMYARTAEKEGYPGIARIFQETAEHEHMHAKTLYKMLMGMKASGEDLPAALHIEAEVPLVFGDTMANLRAAIAGERHEHSYMYPEFSATADAEGYGVVATRLKGIAHAEEYHERRYSALLAALEGGTLHKGAASWVCHKCGYVHEGQEPPAKCPSCDHGKQHFDRLT